MNCIKSTDSGVVTTLTSRKKTLSAQTLSSAMPQPPGPSQFTESVDLELTRPFSLFFSLSRFLFYCNGSNGGPLPIEKLVVVPTYSIEYTA